MWIFLIILNIALPVEYYLVIMSNTEGNILVNVASLIVFVLIVYNTMKNILKIMIVIKRDLKMIDLLPYYLMLTALHFIVKFSGGILESTYMIAMILSVVLYSVFHIIYGRLYTYHIERG